MQEQVKGFTFGRRSKKELASAHEDLREVMNEVIKQTDFVVLCGHRKKADQDKAFAEGKSKLEWPRSKHNTIPARAVDIAPYPINWDDVESFRNLIEKVKAVAKSKKVRIVCGADWKYFPDNPHVELA